MLIKFESLTGLLKTLASKSLLDILLKVRLSYVKVNEYKPESELPADLNFNLYQLKVELVGNLSRLSGLN